VKKILVILGILVLITSLVGCGYPEGISNPPEVIDVPEETPGEVPKGTEQEGGETMVLPPAEGATQGTYGVTEEGMTLTFDPDEYVDQTYITPSVVHIDNFYPGATGEFPIYIHNGDEEASTFIVTVLIPDNPREGFVAVSESSLRWIIITDSSPVVAPKTSTKVWVSLQMPKDAVSPGPKWEFWTAVQKTKQGFIAVRLATRWLVTMK